MAAKETRIIKAGEYLFKEGEQGKELYIIQTGRIRVYRQDKRKTYELGEFSRGSVVGEMALFDDKPRSASAQAVTDCRIVSVDHDHFQNYLEKIPQWLSTIVLMIIKRLRDTTRRIKDDSLDEYLVSTVAWMLTLVIAKHPKKISGVECVGLDTANRVIRGVLDLDVDLLLKCYDALVRKELIKIENGHIIPLQAEQLDLYVQYRNNGIYGALGKDVPEEAVSMLCAIHSYCRKAGIIRSREVTLDMAIFGNEYETDTGERPPAEQLKALLGCGWIKPADSDERADVPTQIVFDKDVVQDAVRKYDLIVAVK